MTTLLRPARFAAAALLAAAVGVPAAFAQGVVQPAGVSAPTLGGQSYNGRSYNGQSFASPPQRFSPPLTGRVRPYPQPTGGTRPYPIPRPRPIYNPNPVVGRDGFVDTEYDPFSNITDVNRQTITTRQSALDPNRGYIDPGSLRRVDRWINVNGKQVREHGTTWTSHGVPHGNLTRDSSTFTPYPGGPGQGGVRENDSNSAIYFAPSAGVGQTSDGGVRVNESETVLRSARYPGHGSGNGNGTGGGHGNGNGQGGGRGGLRFNDRAVIRFSQPR